MKTMLELKQNTLVFKFPEIHPSAELRIDLVRTLRLPDDGKTYPLPPGLGSFPVKMVDDCKDRVPAKWMERGGVMFPMFQAEALWLKFSPQHIANRQGTSSYMFAVRVAAGKVNAVSGEPWTIGVKEGDYMIAPPQPWLDGFCVGPGRIRQFVATPLGWGLTAEQQITGKEEVGGLQIEVAAMKREEFDRRFPERPPPREELTKGGILRSCSLFDSMEFERHAAVACASAEMGLGAGGEMKQDIAQDIYGLNAWDFTRRSRVFAHIANSFAWEAITGHTPPAAPCTAQHYAAKGLPWFDHYVEGMPIAQGGENLKTLKSVLALGFQKGLGIFPNNESVSVPEEKITKYVAPRPQGSVRDGSW